MEFSESDRRFLRSMHCRVDETPPAQDACDTLDAAAHRECKRLAAQLTIWRAAAVVVLDILILAALILAALAWRLL
jgi:hypothetical protein